MNLISSCVDVKECDSISDMLLSDFNKHWGKIETMHLLSHTMHLVSKNNKR